MCYFVKDFIVGVDMSYKLSQIMVVLSSIFLAFSCVYFHTNTIVTTLGSDENITTTETQSIVEKNIITDTIVKKKVVEKEKKVEIIQEKIISEIPIEKSELNNSKKDDIQNVNIEQEISHPKSLKIPEDDFTSLERRMLEELKKEEEK